MIHLALMHLDINWKILDKHKKEQNQNQPYTITGQQ